MLDYNNWKGFSTTKTKLAVGYRVEKGPWVEGPCATEE